MQAASADLHALPASSTPAMPRGGSPRIEQAIQVVLTMLREHMGMDVVFVRHFTDGDRRFRQVEALVHGPAAALATGQPAQAGGTLLEARVVLRDGQVHGLLCGYCADADPAAAQRRLHWLQYGARLAARLLDNEQVLRQLARQALSH